MMLEKSDAPRPPVPAGTELYAGYEAWKGWSKPFTCSAEEAIYFAGETRGLAIEHADVLEIGFGSGSFLAWARARKARVAGTEINPALLAAAEQFGVEQLPAAFEEVAQSHAARFDTTRLLSSGQVTDTYLLGLACAHGGQLASLDRRLVTDAVRGGAQGLHLIG